MQIDFDIIPEIILQAICFFLVYYLFYKRYIYSLLDPLFIYVFTISFSSVLVLNTLSDRPLYVIHFFLCHTFLFAGFRTTNSWLQNRQIYNTQVPPTALYGFNELRILLYSLFVFYMLANIILFYTTGFALLSDDPTVAKVENFSKGFGIILKINWGVGGFLTAGLLFVILSEVRRLDIFLFLIVVLLTALDGSKSSLLRILITFVLLSNHKIFRFRNESIKKLMFFIPVGTFVLIGVFFIILLKENADYEQAVFAFIRRLLYGADSTLYFYLPVNEQYFGHFHFWDFPGHLLNQILGFLRLVSYQEALGNLMVENALPNNTGTIVGPNTPYYIEGQIYFGYFGAFIYSVVVGSCYAFVRQYFFNSRFYTAFWFVLMCCVCQQASALTVEVTLFLTQAFDTFFFVIPSYIFMSVALTGKVKLYKFHF